MRWQTIPITFELAALIRDNEIRGWVEHDHNGGFNATLLGTIARPGNEERWFETEVGAKAWLAAVVSLENAA